MYQKGDFVRLNYTGFFLENGQCIDTTIEENAKKYGILAKNFTYEPVVVCIGETHILPGIDKALVGKKNEKFSIEIEPEFAFGKKSSKSIKQVPLTEFRDQKQRPVVGDQFMYGEKLATVKFVSNRMVMLDFNHPYAGYKVKYDIEVLEKVEDKKDQLGAIVKHELRFDPEKYSIEEKDGKLMLKVKSKEFPKEFSESVKKHVLKLTKAKDFEFVFEE